MKTGNPLLDDPRLQAYGQQRERFQRFVSELQLVAQADPQSRIDAFEEENSPTTFAIKRLQSLGVEVLRPTREQAIYGHRFGPENVLYIWPSTPMRGFVTKAQAANLTPEIGKALPDGGVELQRDCMIRGTGYRAGTVLELWPEQPPTGFLRPVDALEMLRAGDVEAVELQPEESNK